MNFDYRKRKGHGIAGQLSAIGPQHATREDVEHAIAERVQSGKNPEGWKIQITEWRGREVESGQQQRLFFNALKNFHHETEIDHHEPQAATRDPEPLEDDSDSESEGEE